MIDRHARHARGTFSAVSFNSVALIASGALAMAWPPVPALAQSGEIYGQSGGRFFEHSCGPGRVLVGLRGSAGVWVDNIQAICGRLDGPGSFTDATVDGPIFGGNRPQDQHVECPHGYAVSSAAVGLNDDHPYVGAISLTCTELANRRDGGSRHVAVQGTGNLEGYSSPFGLIDATPGSPGGFPTCGGNSFAVGIRGRAEQFLDAFGLLCGPAMPAAADSTAGHTLGKRKKPEVDLSKRPGMSMESSIPQTQHTLGKRKRTAPEPTGGTGSESAPASAINSDTAPGPAQTDQPVGASIFTDSATPTAPQTEQRELLPPSPLINGHYLTTLSVTDSRCIGGTDYRGTWNGALDVEPAATGIVIPLQQYGPIFGGPLRLNVEGLVLTQASSEIPLNIGMINAPAPATFNGNFDADGNRFLVRFEAGNAICRIGGTITGVRG